ncbi:unnamed protein product [Peniophora sp. CBMAI 1063]|nr:unnamed protein product [Peniophora sp. CBMAI 1063]
MESTSHSRISAQILTHSIEVNAYKKANVTNDNPAHERVSEDDFDIPMVGHGTDVSDIGIGEDGEVHEWDVKGLDGIPEKPDPLLPNRCLKKPGGHRAKVAASMITGVVASELYPHGMRHYEKECKSLGIILESRKDWFMRTGMTRYLVDVPARLRGGVDVGLACRVAKSYLEFELSNAKEGPLMMSQNSDVSPGSLYILDLIGTKSKTIWSERAADKTRRKTELDYDVDRSLPRQWVSQQPAERRGVGETLVLSAGETASWNDHLPAGADGVRLLVVTLLSWGWDIRENERKNEVEGWERLARDYVEVLEVLADRSGQFQPPLTGYVIDGYIESEGRR